MGIPHSGTGYGDISLSGATHFCQQRQKLLETGGFKASAYLPPAAPFLSAAKEMGERTPPKTYGFWISFRRLLSRAGSSEMWNRRISLSAAAKSTWYIAL